MARTVILSSYETAVAKPWRNRAANQGNEQGLATTNDWFSYLVLDEAHCAKNPRSERHKLIRTIKRESLVHVSATPIIDTTRDMVGYTKLIWDPLYPFWNDNWISPETRYDDQSWNALVHGEPIGNIASCRIFLWRPTNTLPGSTSFEPRNPLEQAYLDAVRAERPIFLLNPTLFAAFARKTKFSAQFTLQTTRTILQMVMIRRGMDRPSLYQTGTTTSLGQRLSGLTVFRGMLRVEPDVK